MHTFRSTISFILCFCLSAHQMASADCYIFTLQALMATAKHPLFTSCLTPSQDYSQILCAPSSKLKIFQVSWVGIKFSSAIRFVNLVHSTKNSRVINALQYSVNKFSWLGVFHTTLSEPSPLDCKMVPSNYNSQFLKETKSIIFN